MTITLEHLAKHTGVTSQTVSRVFRSPELVKDSTRQRIQEAAREMGYRPNAAAQALRHGQRTGVGLIFASPTTDTVPILFHCYGHLLASLSSQCEEHDLDLMMGLAHHTLTPDEDIRSLPRAVQKTHVGPLIVLTHMWDEFARALNNWRIPTIVIDGPDCGLAAVQTDEVLSMHTLVDHLVSLGHQRIAFCNPGPSGVVGYRDALWPKGYCEAMARHRLRHYPESMQSHDDRFRAFFDLPNPPTAIIAYDDQEAIFLIDHLTRRGLRVPEDISVVAAYEVGATPFSTIPITRVARDDQGMADHAVQWIIENLNRAEALSSEVVRLPAKLVIGKTTAPPPQEKR